MVNKCCRIQKLVRFIELSVVQCSFEFFDHAHNTQVSWCKRLLNKHVQDFSCYALLVWEWTAMYYCILGSFLWYIFLYNFKFSIRIKFRGSNFWTFQVLWAIPYGTHIGLVSTFWLMVCSSFAMQGSDTLLPYLQDNLEHCNSWKSAVQERIW